MYELYDTMLHLRNGYKSDGVAPGSRRQSRKRAQPPDRWDVKEGAGLQSQENSGFPMWQDLFFSHQSAQHWVLLLKGRGGKKAIPTPPHIKGPSAYTQLGALGWVARCWGWQGL